TTSCPVPNDDRPTPGRLSTALSASPWVPGTFLPSSVVTVTRAGSRLRGAAWTVTSTGAGGAPKAVRGPRHKKSAVAGTRLARSRHNERERLAPGTSTVRHLGVDGAARSLREADAPAVSPHLDPPVGKRRGAERVRIDPDQILP